MQVAVTGAAGLLGQGVIRAILAKGSLVGPSGTQEAITRIVASDKVAHQAIKDSRIEFKVGNITDPAFHQVAIPEGVHSVFHFAAVVSGQAEEEFDLGMAVNIDGTRLVLERLRAVSPGARLVITSSVAVFGGDLPDIVPDSHIWEPMSSYGTQKAVCDLLLNDYSRRGFVDGRSLRMPAISIRPGAPNKAASGFASGIIREPLAGIETVCPVGPESLLWLMAPETAIKNLVHAHELPASAYGNRRVVNMPGLSVTVGEMLDVLLELGGPEARRRVTLQPNPAIQNIVNTWPGAFSANHATELGFVADSDFRDVVRAHLTLTRSQA